MTVDQQGEAVEEAVDGVSRLVDGEDYGATIVCHPGITVKNCWQVKLIQWIFFFIYYSYSFSDTTITTTI